MSCSARCCAASAERSLLMFEEVIAHCILAQECEVRCGGRGPTADDYRFTMGDTCTWRRGARRFLSAPDETRRGNGVEYSRASFRTLLRYLVPIYGATIARVPCHEPAYAGIATTMTTYSAGLVLLIALQIGRAS